jgi:cytochrome c oxidase assembly factor CtaG
VAADLILWSIAVWSLAALAAGLFVRGQRSLRRRSFDPSSRLRSIYFIAGAALVAASLAWPLLPLSQTSVLARMAQKVAICLVAAPLLWLSFPLHTLAAGLPFALRRPLTTIFVRHQPWTPALRLVTGPVPAWFLYITAFLIWHDPGFVAWEMVNLVRQELALGLLLVAALLFWHQVTQGGARRYATASPGARVFMLVGAEVPNVVAGITIAFGTTSLYAFYDAPFLAAAPTLSQQSLSGALTWVFGSIVYISAIVAVVNQVFRREGAERPMPLLNWDDEAKFIAPGLESRLRDDDYRPHDWRDR